MKVKEAFYKGFRSKVGMVFFLKIFKSCIDSTPEHFLYLVMGEKIVFLYLVMNALEDTLSNNL